MVGPSSRCLGTGLGFGSEFLPFLSKLFVFYTPIPQNSGIVPLAKCKGLRGLLLVLDGLVLLLRVCASFSTLSSVLSASAAVGGLGP